MQEEVENRTLTLVVSGTKFTGRMFKAAIHTVQAALAVHCDPNSQGAFLLSLRGWKACKAHSYAGPR